MEQSLVGVTSRERVHALLPAAGFAVEREWSSYSFEPYQERDPLLIIEARKAIQDSGQARTCS